ncbi:hypothetical protein PPERSA_02086 [Pseudocohnilembus persalinus]|uniref:P-type ATPase A domain-containing protein n=1 Tax=Pseudocohnilembus persalinus TaxID=266149 RepID=A0A0V0Q811_PSEPJ|nr:hypothetical protein PPERSA_02086 [Pseudocohnilembus persalinus]|eukprot:KRW98309.1 hypothetical protein PPERSA_02086 [Pseudocohnilembus persalinus]
MNAEQELQDIQYKGTTLEYQLQQQNLLKQEQEMLPLNQLKFKQKKRDNKFRSKVLRNSSIQLIPSHEIVVGDILFIEQGDIVLEDGIIISCQSNEIVVSENQEQFSKDISKSAPRNLPSDIYIDPFIYSGSNIMEGQCYMVVCAVGENVCKERCFQQEQEMWRQSPLNRKIKEISSVIGRIGINFNCMIIIFILINCNYS